MPRSPNFDHAMDWLRAGDLAPQAGQDPREAEGEQAKLAMQRRAQAFKGVFGSPTGELVLQTILEASVFRAPVDHRLAAGEYERFAQLRQGQNQLAATILAYLDHAENLERGTEDAMDIHGAPDDGPGGGSGERRGDGGDGDGSGGRGDWSAAVR